MKYYFRPPKWLFTLSLIILAVQLIGQNTKNSKPFYRYAFKAYLTVLHEERTEIFPVYGGRQSTTTRKRTDILPTIGFSKLKKNGAFYEFGLTRLNFQRNDDVTYNQLLYTLDSLGNPIPVSGWLTGFNFIF